MCGGTGVVDTGATCALGLSPRVRGNLFLVHPHGMEMGSIPACAGEPSPSRRSSSGTWVYPRVCGGTGVVDTGATCALGLSPRVRGNLFLVHPHGMEMGSIPACAGEPSPSRRSSSGTWVYPRVCGGTACMWWSGRLLMGLSPRVRGNHPMASHKFSIGGSIPACAGEPRGSSPAPSPSAGLSPRVRGNRVLRDS